MANILPPYIAELTTAFAQRSSERLEGLVAVHPAHQSYGQLQSALNSVPESSFTIHSISPVTSTLPAETRDNWASFVVALLRYTRLPDEGGFEAIHTKYTALVTAYTSAELFRSEANKVYATVSDGIHTCACLNPVILAFARHLITLSGHVASLSTLPPRDPRSPRSIRDTTRQTLERSMQIASTSYSADDWSLASSRGPVVGDIMWKLGNMLWRIFAQRQLHTQAAELIRTFSAVSPAEDKRIHSRAQYIHPTDVCQSYYWRGRLGVKLLDMRNAKYWLDKAWGWCPEDSWKQRRAILIRLIPVNLLLGLLPDPAMLRAYSLTHFQSLIHHFKTGNVAAWRQELEEKREWYRRRSIWLILFERGEILVWRNLLRRALRLHYQTNPAAPLNRCPTSVFLRTVRQAFEGTGEVEDGVIELEDIIVIVASCIDHGLILGNLAYSQSQLVMKPSQDGMGGFPKISTVTPRRIEANQ